MLNRLWCHLVARQPTRWQHNQQTRIVKPARRAFRPVLEWLEERWLPAVTLTPDPVALAGSSMAAGVYSGVVDHFTDTGRPDAQATDFTVAIDWGDASPVSYGTVQAQPDGSFEILGRHTYHEGTYFPTVNITDRVAAVTVGAISGSWTSGLAPMPTARYDLAAATGPDGRIYAIGGRKDDFAPLDTVEVYDPATNVWSTAVPMGTRRRAPVAAASGDGRIYAIGGIGPDDFSTLNTVEALDVVTNRWSPVAPMPTARSFLAAAVGGNGRIYAIGGNSPTNTALQTVEVYDLNSKRWLTVAPMPTERYLFAAVAGADGRIYAIGGRTSTFFEGTTTVDVYDPATNLWTSAAPMPITQYFSLTAVAGPDGHIYVIGTNGTVEVYNPARDTWVVASPLPNGDYAEAAAVGADGHIYVIGPGSLDALTLQPLHVLHGSLTAGTVSLTLTQGVPFSGAVVGFQSSNTLEQAGDFKAVIHWGDGTADSAGMVRGGFGRFTVSGSHTFAQAGGYHVLVDITDPAGVHVTAGGRPTWSSYPAMPNVAGGMAAAATPDGRIYTLGGVTGLTSLATVQVSDQATGLWSFAAAMPTARNALAAVTGADGSIYALGGFDALSGDLAAFDTAEVYDPATDSWFTAAPMPTPREWLAAVAGPDGRIYAIGGYNRNGYLGTVEVYDPVKNSWSTAAPMPTPREALAAVAGPDGRIYAIGGANSNGVLGTVEAYDPVTNRWSTVTSMPTPRLGVAAVAGPDGRIYAIGGYNNGTLTTVEAYDPRSNTWDTTIQGLHAARTYPAAVRGADGRLYVLGGNNWTAFLPTVEALDYGSGATVAQPGAVLNTSPGVQLSAVRIRSNSPGVKITAGPDGNVWFTEISGLIERLDPVTHNITGEYRIPTPDCYPDGITTGPDGNLWFVEANGNQIGRVNLTTLGTNPITEFPIPTPNSGPAEITAGRDGNLWFTEEQGYKIGKINPATGAIQEYPLPVVDGNFPHGITTGPDGRLWVTLGARDPEEVGGLGAFDPGTGVFKKSAIPDVPYEITAGPDRNLWFTETGVNQIGVINADTGAVREFPLPTGYGPRGIVLAADGDLWFTENNSIGTIDPSTHAIREFPIPDSLGTASAIANGPDGNLWYVDPATTIDVVGEVKFPAGVSALAGFNQSATIGTAFANPLKVLVTDFHGQPASNVSVVFTAPASGPAGTFSGGSATATVVTDGDGFAMAPAFTANTQAGAFAVTASASGGSASFQLTNIGATRFVVSGFPPVVAGTSASFTVTALDPSGQPVTAYAGTVTFFASGVAGVPAPATLTNGTGTFTATLYTAGLQALGASDGTISGQQDHIIVMPGGPAQLTITAGGVQSAGVNTAYAQPLVVLATDANGNPVGATPVVFTAPTSGPGGRFGAGATATVLTDINGMATAPTFTANTWAGSFSVTATAGPSAPPAAFVLTNNPGLPAALAVVGGPGQSAIVGKAYSPPLQVRITDAYGNPLAMSGVSVDFTAPGTGASGKFANGTSATALTDDSGIATAPSFTANTRSGNFAVTATSRGLTAASISLTNTAAKPATIVVAPNAPKSAGIGDNYAPNLQALVKDAYGNPCTGVIATFTVHPNRTNSAGADFGNTRTATAMTDANGLATAPTLRANLLKGTFTVTAATSGVATAATFSLTNTKPLTSPPGMVSWFKGEGDARDAVGGNNGSLHNVTFVRGKVGQAFQFDGATSYVQVPNSPTLESPTVTVEAWVNSAAPNLFGNVLSKGGKDQTAASYALYTGYTGSPGLFFYIFDGSKVVLSPDAGPAIWDGQWHHVAGTYDGSAVRLYVDGKEIGSGTRTTIKIAYGLSAGNDLYLASYLGDQIPSGYRFAGLIDEPTIYNRALSAAEIKGIFAAGSAGKPMAKGAAQRR
jgi:streptogramin lyase/N-acetylneuraminic acid mutarotase